MRISRLVSGIVAALILQLPVRAAQPSAVPTPCAFPAAEIAWLQRALDGWDRVSRQFLRIDASPLPWIVLFDTSCVWHLSSDGSLNPDAVAVPSTLSFAGNPVPVRALTHKGTVLLPSGSLVA